MKHSSIILVGCLLCIGALSSCKKEEPSQHKGPDPYYVKVIKFKDPSYKNYLALGISEIDGDMCWRECHRNDSLGFYFPSYPYWELDDDYLLVDWRQFLEFFYSQCILLMPWDTLIARIEAKDTCMRGPRISSPCLIPSGSPLFSEYKQVSNAAQSIYDLGMEEIEHYFGKSFKQGDWEHDVFYGIEYIRYSYNLVNRYCQDSTEAAEADSLWAELVQQINILIKDDMLPQISSEYLERVKLDGRGHLGVDRYPNADELLK